MWPLARLTGTQWAAQLKNAASALPAAMARTALQLSLMAEAEGKKNATTRLSVRTGHLRNSVHGSVSSTGDVLQIRVAAGGRSGGADVRYARIQDQGGTVRARSGGKLRMPLPVAKTAAGVDRLPGPLRLVAPGRFHARRSKRGNLLLFDNSTGAPHYLLLDSITIRPTRFLEDAAKDTARRAPALVLKTIAKTMGA